MIMLRFVTCDRDPVSRLIQFAQYGFWASHVEAVMPDGALLGAHHAGGVQARPPGYDAGVCTRELRVGLPADQRMTDFFHQFLRLQLGKPYDTEAIAAFVMRRDWQRDDCWFCSELQAAALVECGWFGARLATEFNHITPRDLLLIVSGRVDVTTEVKETGT